MGSARPRLAGSRSPRQVCKSEPHTLASVIRTSAAPGAGWGSGYSLSSSGWPTPRKTAALPDDPMQRQPSAEQRAGELGVLALDHTAVAVRADRCLRSVPALAASGAHGGCAPAGSHSAPGGPPHAVLHSTRSHSTGGCLISPERCPLVRKWTW